MTSKSKRTCNPIPMEDVQGDNRWMDMVSFETMCKMYIL